PCINAGSNLSMLTEDQRGSGFARVIGSAADIGAYEVQPPPCVSGKTVTINGGAAQRSRVTSVRVGFDQVVTLPGSPETAFELRRQSDNGLVALTAAVTNDTATHVTLTFTGALSDFGSLQDGRYTLTVFASKVSNANGSLDGDCNGAGGDDFVLIGDPATNKLHRFFGDVDGDGDTDASNFLTFRNVFLGIAPYDSALDFNGSGSVDAADFLQFRNRYLAGSV